MPTRKIQFTRGILHILIWALLAFILLGYPYTINKHIAYPPEFLTKQIVHFFVMLFVYYINVYCLVPILLFKKKYLLFILTLICVILISAFFMTFISRWLELQDKYPFSTTATAWRKLHLDRFATYTSLILLGISTLWAILRKWNVDSSKLMELEQQKTQAELATLRAQIQPHFLFNTFNTVYALSYLDTEASRKALAQLSRLMRHQLYEVQHGETSLLKELSFIKDYVEIMRLRIKESIAIDFHSITGNDELQIAPMILICYIENVFKHGIDDQIMDCQLCINISLEANKLMLYTKNNIASTDKYWKKNNTGIGMLNTKRRLELLYPDKHQLTTSINTEKNVYELTLTIQLL